MNPARGEIWFVNLDPVTGHEQGGRRPALILSLDQFNASKADLVIVLPMTSVEKRIASHVRVEPGNTNGLRQVSFVKCEEVRCVSKERLGRLCGSVDTKTMQEVEYRVKAILGLL